MRNIGRKKGLYLMFACILIAYCLYIPPYLLQYDPLPALLACLINVMQVITVDADFLFSHDAIVWELGTGIMASLYTVFLAVIHVALPAISAMTAVTLVMRYLKEIQLRLIKRKKTELHIFSQMNYRSILLAKDIRQNRPNCDILFLGEQGDSDYTDLKQELHCTILSDSIEQCRPDAADREVYYYCISDDPEENLNASITIASDLQDKDQHTQENNHIFLFAPSTDVELLVDATPKGFVNFSIIDEDRTDAYRLMERYPLAHYAKDHKIHVLICGLTDQGRAVLRAASWCGQLYGYHLRISVVGRNIEDSVEDFKTAYPGLFTDRYDIHFYNYRNDAQLKAILKENCSDATYVVTTCETEQESIDKAVFLRRFFYRADGTFTCEPPIFACINNVKKAEAVAAMTTAEARPDRRVPYNIIPFGVAAELYTVERITSSRIETMSKNVHLVYEDIFSDTDIDVPGALKRYNQFEVNKSSNRANAIHIRYKLAMLGLDYTDSDEGEEVDLSNYLVGETLEELTYAEHDRWMAFLESEGWEECTVEESKRYQSTGVSRGRHNSPLLKLHPYICPFEELKDRSDQLGLPDSTVYDRELIARIPDILHDKWGVSGKKYRIIQLDTK